MIIDDLFEASQSCPHCGGPMFSEMLMMEKKDACYYKVKASAKVWPSAYASGRLVQCRKKGAGNYGNKSEGVMEMDKSQTPPGRDGSNDEGGKKEYTAKATTAKKVAKDAEKILNKELNKKQGVAEATGDQKFDSMMGQITGGATARQSVDSLNKSLTARTGSDPETALAKWGQEFINWLEKICRNFERQGVDRFNKLEKVGNLDDGGETMAHWLIEVAKQSNTSGITQADIQEFSSEFNTHGMWAWHQFPIAWGLKEWQDYKDQWTGPDGYIANLGQGMAEGSESDAYGNTGEKHECGSCDGTGIDTHDDECPECGGKGWVRDKESLKKKGMAEEYELAGVGVAYELGRRAYKQGMTIRDNPYSATREARKNDEWAKGLERGKHDANDARHFRSSVREQGVEEGLAQDEAEEYGGWRAEFVNEINYNTFEVKLTNSRSKESANFIVRPVDMVSNGPTLSIETMDVHDLQTGQTESWTNDDPAPDGPIAYAISGLFYDDKQLQKKLQNIIDTHDTKGQDMMPGLEKRRSIGQEVDADAYIDSQEKTQAAMAKMKKGVAEKLGDNRPKLGSKRDSGKSIRKWRSARGLDETGVAEGDLDEGWKEKLGGAALAGAMALGAGGANARVMPGDDPGINRLTGKPIATQQATDTAPARTDSTSGFSKEYLQKAANPDRFGRYLISIEKAQELLKQMNEGVAEEAPPGDKAERMVKHIKKSYAKDGKITDKEKGIAYATAWKAHNAGKLEEQNMSDEQATLQAKLQELEKQYDPSFEYSDDYRVWTQQKGIQNQINSIKQQLARLNETAPKEKEADYGADYQDMVARVKKLAGLGPLKTVYDPAKRVYRNVPTAPQPKK